MGYCRMGHNDSDVYMFGARDAVECSMCRLDQTHPVWGVASFSKRTDAVAHLHAHRAAGHFVPEYAIRRLELEIEHDSDDARTNPWDSAAFEVAWSKWCDENDPWEERVAATPDSQGEG